MPKPVAFNWQENHCFKASEETTNPLRVQQTEAVMVLEAFRYQNDKDGIVPDEIAASLRAKGTTTDERSTGAIVVSNKEWPAKIAPTLDAHYGDKQGLEDQHINGGGGYSSRPIIMSTGQGGAEIMEGKSPTLNCNHEAPIVVMGKGKDE